MNTDQEKLTKRAAQFDECFAELSPEAQAELTQMIKFVSNDLSKGGASSSKELIFQFLRLLEKHQPKGE